MPCLRRVSPLHHDNKHPPSFLETKQHTSLVTIATIFFCSCNCFTVAVVSGYLRANFQLNLHEFIQFYSAERLETHLKELLFICEHLS